MNKVFRKCRWMRVGVLGLLIFCVGVSSGCEPLRKKFVRKKKEEDVEKPIVILDPEDYAAAANAGFEIYKKHYQLWKIWQSDLSTTFNENRSDKKALSSISSMQTQLFAMQKLLKVDEQRKMDVVLNQLSEIASEYQKPEGLRNKVALDSKIRGIGRQVRQNFAPEKIKDQLGQK